MGFQFCERLSTDIPTEDLQFGGQIFLRPTFAVAQFADLRPNQIQRQ